MHVDAMAPQNGLANFSRSLAAVDEENLLVTKFQNTISRS